MRFGEDLVEHHFILAPRLHEASFTDEEAIECRLPLARERVDGARDGLVEAFDLEVHARSYAGLHRADALHELETLRIVLRCPANGPESVGKAKLCEIGLKRIRERMRNARHRDKRRYARHDHETDGHGLAAHRFEVPQQFEVDVTHLTS